MNEILRNTVFSQYIFYIISGEMNPVYFSLINAVIVVALFFFWTIQNHILISKMFSELPKKGLLQNKVHYYMEALNTLECEIAENIEIYYNEEKLPVLEETDDMEQTKKLLDMQEVEYR